MTRAEFGFERTVCACEACTLHCHHVSGMLIPQDLDRFLAAEGPEWVADNLLASPGAIVSENGRVFRIPTIVPKRREDGSCQFLENERCRIHATAFYGCAFFDSHMAADEGLKRSHRGLEEILKAGQSSTYAQVWRYLWNSGRRAKSPEQCRQQMRQDDASPSPPGPPAR